MDKTLEQRIHDLVKEEFSRMKMSKKYSNQAILAGRCQSVIYDNWGIGNDNIWKMVDKYVEQYIPDHMD